MGRRRRLAENTGYYLQRMHVCTVPTCRVIGEAVYQQMEQKSLAKIRTGVSADGRQVPHRWAGLAAFCWYRTGPAERAVTSWVR